eukprot:m.264710 g.264710  ORF g.264710 m.264710 type:complete len:59 (+) comp57682_c0_seq1:192-368(+)
MRVNELQREEKPTPLEARSSHRIYLTIRMHQLQQRCHHDSRHHPDALTSGPSSSSSSA